MGNTKSKKKNITSSSSDKKKNEEDKKPISPQIITLAKKTNFSTTDLQKLYDEFRDIAAQSNDDPNELTKEQFLDVLDKHEVDWRSDVFVEHLFDAFDISQTQTLNFREFIRALNFVSVGNAHDKLGLSFKIYDVENSGVIRKWEMKLVLEEIYLDAKKFWKDDMNSTNNNSEKKELLRKKIADTVNAIYDQFDKDQTGQLSFMEYVQAAMSLPELADFMNGVDVVDVDIKTLVEERKAKRNADADNGKNNSNDDGKNNNNNDTKRRFQRISETLEGTELINDLADSTKFNTNDVKNLLEEFKKLANGKYYLRKNQANAIKEIIESSKISGDKNVSIQSENIVVRLFDAFDSDNSGTIDFKQFVIGLNKTSKGTKRDKIELAFSVYDVDGSGRIYKDEFIEIFNSLHQEKKKKTTDDNTKNVNEFADEIFSHFDKDKKGLSFMEFINASLKNPTLNDVLKEEL